MAINEAIIIADLFSGLILEVNKVAVDFFKLSADSLVGSYHGDYYFPAEKKRYEEFWFLRRICGLSARGRPVTH